MKRRAREIPSGGARQSPRARTLTPHAAGFPPSRMPGITLADTPAAVLTLALCRAALNFEATLLEFVLRGNIRDFTGQK